MTLKIFSPKNLAKILAFLTQIKAKLCKKLIITLVFEKNANFFVENGRKSQKIVIITSTPDEFVKKIAQNVAHIICQN
jgi:phosphoserine phosphatase